MCLNRVYDKIYVDKSLEGYTTNSGDIYTDNGGNKSCSLHAKYQLTTAEINIIESVIEERK